MFINMSCMQDNLLIWNEIIYVMFSATSHFIALETSRCLFKDKLLKEDGYVGSLADDPDMFSSLYIKRSHTHTPEISTNAQVTFQCCEEKIVSPFWFI